MPVPVLIIICRILSCSASVNQKSLTATLLSLKSEIVTVLLEETVLAYHLPPPPPFPHPFLPFPRRQRGKEGRGRERGAHYRGSVICRQNSL